MTANSNNIKDLNKLKNKGWQGMNQLLDSQMPVVASSGLVWWKTKLFLISGGILLLGLGFFAGRLTSGETSELSSTTTDEKTETLNGRTTLAKVNSLENTEAIQSDAPANNFTDNRTLSETTFDSKKTSALNQERHSSGIEMVGKEQHTAPVSHTSEDLATQALHNSTPEKAPTGPIIHATSVPMDNTLAQESNPGNKASNTPKPEPSAVSEVKTTSTITSEEDIANATGSEPITGIVASEDASATTAGKESTKGSEQEELKGFMESDSKVALDAHNPIDTSSNVASHDSTLTNTAAVVDSMATNDSQEKDNSLNFRNIKPRTFLESFKSEGYELGGSFGISSIRGDASSFAHNFYLSKRLWGPIGLGLSHGSMELRTKEFAYFSTAEDRTTGGFAVGDEQTKYRTYENRQVHINRLCFQQTGLYLTLHVRQFMEIDFAALRTKTTYLAYNGEYTFIDSTFKYKAGILVSAEQDSHTPGRFESDEWGDDLNKFGIRNFTSYELGLRINLTKNIAIGGKMGFSTESPFTSEHIHNHLFDYENDQQEGRFVSQINYVKAGITLYL